MDSMNWNDRASRFDGDDPDEPRERPRHPMAALLVILALTCTAIFAADRSGPFLASIGIPATAAE